MGGAYPQLFPFLMMLSLATGFVLSQRYKQSLPIGIQAKLFIAMAAFCGATLAAKIPYLIPGLPGFKDAENLLIGGKTILFGMVGGYAGVEFAKWNIGLKAKTGDTFVVPVAASIAIGRLACFCGGCCYGTPTALPWGVLFPAVDNVARHPTQIYEFGFHFLAAIVFAAMIRRNVLKGQLIKLYFIAYFLYRFATEFIRPEPRVVAGLTAYQLAVMLFVPIFVWLFYRDAAHFRALRTAEAS